MSLSIEPTYSSLPDPFTHDDLTGYVEATAFNLTGTVGTSDIQDGAVTAAKSTPGAYWYAAGTLSGGVYTVTLNPALASLATGSTIIFKADAANTGAVNVNVNSLGSKDLLKPNGAELDAGDIAAGAIVTAQYNGTAWQIASIKSKPDRIYGGTATGTADAVTLTLTPSTLTLAELTGTEIEFTTSGANTSTVTLQVNALTAKAVTRVGTVALTAGELRAGQVVRVVYDGTQFQLVTPTYTSTNASVTGMERGLKVKRTTSARVTIQADEIAVKDSSGNVAILSTVSTYADMGTSGALGLDTGAEASNTWYYIWLIYNATSGTPAGLFSTSATSPTLPTGYTYKARLGIVRNDGSSDFVKFSQAGRKIWTEAKLAYGPAASPTVVTVTVLNDYIPALATEVFGVIGITENFDLQVVMYDDGNTDGVQCFNVQSTGVAYTAMSAAGFYASAAFDLPISGTASSVVWSTYQSKNYEIHITGYVMP